MLYSQSKIETRFGYSLEGLNAEKQVTEITKK